MKSRHSIRPCPSRRCRRRQAGRSSGLRRACRDSRRRASFAARKRNKIRPSPMKSSTDQMPPRASLAIDNLRAVVILLVLAFHSVLAYLNFLPATPFAFDSPPFLGRSIPVVDTVRWFGFDLFCAWLDVFLMSFFFLLSGLFVWPSLERKGARSFLFDRLLRIGLPFLLIALLLIPLAHYPTYLQTATEPRIEAFWRHWLAFSFWASGTMWFLWLLDGWVNDALGLLNLILGH